MGFHNFCLDVYEFQSTVTFLENNISVRLIRRVSVRLYPVRSCALFEDDKNVLNGDRHSRPWPECLGISQTSRFSVKGVSPTSPRIPWSAPSRIMTPQAVGALNMEVQGEGKELFARIQRPSTSRYTSRPATREVHLDGDTGTPISATSTSRLSIRPSTTGGHDNAQGHQEHDKLSQEEEGETGRKRNEAERVLSDSTPLANAESSKGDGTLTEEVREKYFLMAPYLKLYPSFSPWTTDVCPGKHCIDVTPDPPCRKKGTAPHKSVTTISRGRMKDTICIPLPEYITKTELGYLSYSKFLAAYFWQLLSEPHLG